MFSIAGPILDAVLAFEAVNAWVAKEADTAFNTYDAVLAFWAWDADVANEALTAFKT